MFRRNVLVICTAAALFAAATLLAVTATPQAAFAGSAMHKVVFHVDDNDPKRMHMALNNIKNTKAYYKKAGQDVEIELVAYGPGLHMLRADTSPVKDRIATMALEIEGLQFSACGNTHARMSKKAGKDVVLLDEAQKVPSGVVRLIQLQEQGYAYIRP